MLGVFPELPRHVDQLHHAGDLPEVLELLLEALGDLVPDLFGLVLAQVLLLQDVLQLLPPVLFNVLKITKIPEKNKNNEREL